MSLPFINGTIPDASDFNALSIKSEMASTIGAGLVGTIGSGSGAVSRTVKSKLNDVVSVKDFGAVGDGVTDDTAAIQAAINYVQSLSFGGFLYIPSGYYRVSSSLTISSANKIYIVGDGSASRIGALSIASNGPVFLITGSVNSNGSVISDLVIVGPSSGTTKAISATNATGWYFKNLWIQNQSVAMEFSSSYSLLIDKCTITNCTDSAVRFLTVAHNGVIRDCSIFACGVTETKPAIDFTDFSTSNFLVDGCDIEQCYNLVGLKNNISFTFSNNYSEQTVSTIFFMNATQSQSIEYISNYTGPSAGFVIEYADGYRIENNSFFNTAISFGTSTNNVKYTRNKKTGTGNELVNYVSNIDANDTGTPKINAQGFAANIGINFASKGTGSSTFYASGGSAIQFEVNGTNTGTSNWLIASGQASGTSYATLSAFGSVDANVGIQLVMKGSGYLRIPIANVPNAANDAAAAGLTPAVPIGGFYRNGSVLMIRVT